MLIFPLLCGLSIQAQTIINSKFGKGVYVMGADTPYSLKFSARFQTLYQGNCLRCNAGVPAARLKIR